MKKNNVAIVPSPGQGRNFYRPRTWESKTLHKGILVHGGTPRIVRLVIFEGRTRGIPTSRGKKTKTGKTAEIAVDRGMG